MEKSGCKEEAFVTLATNDSYATGALVLGDSLKKVNTCKKLAIIVTRDVSQIQRQRLSQLWDYVLEVEKLESNDKINLALIERPELSVTFTKLKIWTLEQFQKCVFMDADTLVIQNIDDLFERDELSAAPDIGWPDCFNSGVFVFVPSQETYTALIQFADEHGSFDGGDQGLLNMYFKSWITDMSYHLPFTYNMVSSTSYTYIPAYNHYGSDVKVVHFLGAAKPWTQHYDYNRSQLVFTPSAKENGQQRHFTQVWWDRYNALPPPVSVEPTGDQPQFDKPVEYHDENKFATENNVGNGQEAWEHGAIDFTRRDRFSTIQYHLDQTIGGTGYSQAFEEESYDDYYECQTGYEAQDRSINEQHLAFEANFESTSTEYISVDQSNDRIKSGITKQENYTEEMCYAGFPCNYEEDKSDAKEGVLDAELVRMLRWENSQIDFRGEDRFEFIENYLDGLIEKMANAAISAESVSKPNIKDTNDKGDDKAAETRNLSPTLSLPDSAFSELTTLNIEKISRATQTDKTAFVSKSMQTEV
eukprot:gene11399-12586_t